MIHNILFFFSRAGFQSKRDDIAKESADFFNEHNREVGSLTKAINEGKAIHSKQSKKVIKKIIFKINTMCFKDCLFFYFLFRIVI